jgi:hypothetical protein
VHCIHVRNLSNRLMLLLNSDFIVNILITYDLFLEIICDNLIHYGYCCYFDHC